MGRAARQLVASYKMRGYIVRLIALFAGLIVSLSGGAAGSRVSSSPEIVYSARYYNPPGAQGTSHFHIYRVRADGSHRRQLTFGDADDHYPSVSPDGRFIAFTRERK